MTKHFCDVCGKELTDFGYYEVSFSPRVRTTEKDCTFHGAEVCRTCVATLYATIESLRKEMPKC